VGFYGRGYTGKERWQINRGVRKEGADLMPTYSGRGGPGKVVRICPGDVVTKTTSFMFGNLSTRVKEEEP